MKKIKRLFVLLIIILATTLCYKYSKNLDFNPKYEIGQELDSLNGVKVFYNGGVSNVEERNVSRDGYNLGLKYQCVEFVKRYYFEHYNHKMPDSYGNAKDFFQEGLNDGAVNKQRNLLQFTNPSVQKPEEGDLVVYGPSVTNRFGHVSIVSKVNENEIEVIQQNPGPFGSSRETFELKNNANKWKIENGRIMGWLRKD